MSNSEEVKKTIILKSNDGETFEVLLKSAAMSVTLKEMIEDVDVGDEIPLPLVSGKVLAKVVMYCNNHSLYSSDEDSNDGSDEATDWEKEDKLAKEWDKEFINMDLTELFELILAANYLNIKGLLSLGTQAIADQIKNMSPEQVRKVFNITNDFTPEEEEVVRKENAYAHE